MQRSPPIDLRSFNLNPLMRSVAIAVLAFCASSASLAQPGALQHLFSSALATQQSQSGFSVGATKAGKVVVITGMGKGVHLDGDSQFYLASVSKQFTAAAILALEADGALTLSDPLGKYLPEFPAWSKLKIRDLLAHRTSLADFTSADPYQAGGPFQGPIATGDLLSLAYGLPQPVPAIPLPCIQYSNTNYAALAAVVERASGQSFADYLEEKIFSPLDMSDTSYSPSTQPSLVPGRRGMAAAAPSYGSWANGAGGIVSTAKDMLKWDQAIADGFMNIKSRVAKDLSTGACGNGAVRSYAYGWTMDRPGVLEHSGSMPLDGYATFNSVDLNRQVAVVVLTNNAANSGGLPQFVSQVSNLVAGGSLPAQPQPAYFCCTAFGKFGPGPNPSGQTGLPCYWQVGPYPAQVAYGKTCP